MFIDFFYRYDDVIKSTGWIIKNELGDGLVMNVGHTNKFAHEMIGVNTYLDDCFKKKYIRKEYDNEYIYNFDLTLKND